MYLRCNCSATTNAAPCCNPARRRAVCTWATTWSEFMLRRFSRDLGSLLKLLDRLDRFSLRTARPITVPLLKTMLESDPHR